MLKRTSEERQLAERAFRYLPGGSLGNVYASQERAFFIKRGKGSRVWDVSDNEYIDYLLGSGDGSLYSRTHGALHCPHPLACPCL